MTDKSAPIRVGIYGCGTFAVRTHIPNLLQQPGVRIVALCDRNPAALEQAGDQFNIEPRYTDGHLLLDHEQLDALYSVVPAFARTDVEIRAAELGIHLFSEKPQALTMEGARAIDAAITRAGVLSTVGFRERYRPLFQEARRLLQGREIYHVRFQLAHSVTPPPAQEWSRSWQYQFDKNGGTGFDWGVHATDYIRFMTGLEIVRVHSTYVRRPTYPTPLVWSFHYLLSNGATASLDFITAAGAAVLEPWFTVYYDGGRLELWRYDRIDQNGETVYTGEPFDPWLAQDRAFVEAVRSGSAAGLLSDYHDGLYSLAPILAGWASAQQEGVSIDLASFVEEPR